MTYNVFISFTDILGNGWNLTQRFNSRQDALAYADGCAALGCRVFTDLA